MLIGNLLYAVFGSMSTEVAHTTVKIDNQRIPFVSYSSFFIFSLLTLTRIILSVPREKI